jgi:hypothetical protein
MLVKQKEKTMKFNRYYNDELTYLVWEREDNNNVIITKMRGSKTYKVENLETGYSETLTSLRTAKEFGQIL